MTNDPHVPYGEIFNKHCSRFLLFFPAGFYYFQNLHSNIYGIYLKTYASLWYQYTHQQQR